LIFSGILAGCQLLFPLFERRCTDSGRSLSINQAGVWQIHHLHCEASVSLHTVRSALYRRFGRVVLAAVAAQVLLFAGLTETSASSLAPSALETLLPASPLARSNVSDGYEADSARQEPLDGNSVSRVTSPDPAAEEPVPDWDGIWRDTGILIGSQVVAAGLIYVMPESVSNWSTEQKKESFKKYARNVADPVFDKDKFYINYVLHPYWGAAYYIRGRERGLDRASSFVYSTLLSAMYEFGVEAFFEKPSIQDLIVTPVAGSLLGAFIFEPWRASIRSKQELQWYDHAALIVTDPAGVLSLGFEKLFGIQSTIMVDYSIPQLQKHTAEHARVSPGNRIGVSMSFPLN
jgi:hypothetical protein